MFRAREPHEVGFVEHDGVRLHPFGQNNHVRHRLDRYRAGRKTDLEAATPGVIAESIATEIGREVNYRDVENRCARRAVVRLAEIHIERLQLTRGGLPWPQI